MIVTTQQLYKVAYKKFAVGEPPINLVRLITTDN